MNEEKFLLEKDDKFGLGFADLGEKIPYVAIKVSAEEAKQIEHRKMEFYSIDGRTLFEIRKDNKPTGEYMFFVIFQ